MHERIKKILDDSCPTYRVRPHKDLLIPILSPQDFASALGYDINRITKTLLLRATDREMFCLAVLSSNKRVNLEKVAGTLQLKRIQMASKQELSKTLGYPPT